MELDFLPMHSLYRLFEALAPFGEMHGPVLSDDGVVIFGPVGAPETLLLDYSRTLLPPKKYLLPPRETLLDYSPLTGYRPGPRSERRFVLFGIHACDLSGIAYLDQAFASDAAYQSRRTDLTLVGLSCTPDDYCFCGDLGGTGRRGFDVFLHRTGTGFYVESGSPKGERIVSGLALPREDVTIPLDPPARCGVENAILETAARGETFPDSPLWDDFAARCLSCGACSLCCPTCYCHDVREQGKLDGESAERFREWDNCLFTDFGVVAGGFNFRKHRRERFHYRHQHKYLGFGPVRGIIACVGCGRCREACPVRIDLLDLFGGKAHGQER